MINTWLLLVTNHTNMPVLLHRPAFVTQIFQQMFHYPPLPASDVPRATSTRAVPLCQSFVLFISLLFWHPILSK